MDPLERREHRAIEGDPLPAESLLTRGWRAEHVLPDLLAVLDGQRTIRIADVAADAPFAFEDRGNGVPTHSVLSEPAG